MKWILALAILAIIVKDIVSGDSGEEKCGENEIYEKCQSSSCRELPCNTPEPLACTKDCVSKCFCLRGYARNKDGVCQECPKNDSNPSGCSNSAEDSHSKEDSSDSHSKEDSSDSRSKENSSSGEKKCPKNEVWSDCISPCKSQRCNETISEEPTMCIQMCRGEGCICKDNLRRDTNGKCVKC